MNYASYLLVFYEQLLNLPWSHPVVELLLAEHGFSVSQSNVPSGQKKIIQNYK